MNMNKLNLISVSTSSRNTTLKLNVVLETCFLICRMLGCKSTFLKAISIGPFSSSVLFEGIGFQLCAAFWVIQRKNSLMFQLLWRLQLKFPGSCPFIRKEGFNCLPKHCIDCEASRVRVLLSFFFFCIIFYINFFASYMQLYS